MLWIYCSSASSRSCCYRTGACRCANWEEVCFFFLFSPIFFRVSSEILVALCSSLGGCSLPAWKPSCSSIPINHPLCILKSPLLSWPQTSGWLHKREAWGSSPKLRRAPGVSRITGCFSWHLLMLHVERNISAALSLGQRHQHLLLSVASILGQKGKKPCVKTKVKQTESLSIW